MHTRSSTHTTSPDGSSVCVCGQSKLMSYPWGMTGGSSSSCADTDATVKIRAMRMAANTCLSMEYPFQSAKRNALRIPYSDVWLCLVRNLVLGSRQPHRVLALVIFEVVARLDLLPPRR